MPNQHDSHFKQLMAQRTFFEPFIKTYLPPELLERMDWQSIRLYKMGGKHLEENTNKEFESDVIYLAKFGESDGLRFMVNPLVPFTNNLAENDLRMTKVQQKISGCFRSIEGALIFSRIRGYPSTCCKHDVSMTDALALLFQGEMPAFVQAAA